jgi:ATP-dependent Lon protease
MSETKQQKLERIGRETAGFVERELWTYNSEKSRTMRLELMLPNTPEIKKYIDESYHRATALEWQTRQAQEELKRKIEEQLSGRDEIEDDDIDAAKSEPEKPVASLSKRERDDHDKDPVIQKKILQARAAADTLKLDYDDWAPVYDPLEPLKLLDSSRQTFGDKGQSLEVYKSLREKGHMRRLASVSAERADEIFGELEVSHPLFIEVTKFVRDQMRLCQRRGLPFHLAPILLAGVPGTGKTHYTKALAEATGASYHEMGFDTERTSSSFLGSSAHWSNTQPGIVYRALAMEDNASANPIILLDEICKSRAGGYQDPLTSLHGLLEPVSNKKVTDISVSMTMDASLISWIATANDLSRVLPSILSRFRIFVIMPALDGLTGLKVATQVVNTTHKAMDLEGFTEPGPDVIRCIASLLIPRVMRVALEMAYGTATAEGRTFLSAKDFERLDPDFVPPKEGATVYH